MFQTISNLSLKKFLKRIGRKIFKKKKHQNNHFRAKIGQKEQELVRRKVKKKIEF